MVTSRLVLASGLGRTPAIPHTGVGHSCDRVGWELDQKSPRDRMANFAVPAAIDRGRIERNLTPWRVWLPRESVPKVDLDSSDLGEREWVIVALEDAGWVQAKAARLLNMTPRQIADRIQTLNI